MGFREEPVAETKLVYFCDFCKKDTEEDYDDLYYCPLCGKAFCYTCRCPISGFLDAYRNVVCLDCFPLVETINEEVEQLGKNFSTEKARLRSAFYELRKK